MSKKRGLLVDDSAAIRKVVRLLHIWYYEHPLPEGRKNYSKTNPIRFEEFASCSA
jgi:hypothetical protein